LTLTGRKVTIGKNGRKKGISCHVNHIISRFGAIFTEVGGKRQEAGGKRQEAGGRRQEAKGKRQKNRFIYLTPVLPTFHSSTPHCLQIEKYYKSVKLSGVGFRS
jgi:hypothetical protein